MIIYGASGHGKVLYEIAMSTQKDRNVKFADDHRSGIFAGAGIISASNIVDTDRIVIGIGNNKIRKTISERLINNIFERLVHPGSFLSDTAILGAGSVVMAGASINASARIGKHVILNTNCSVDHDCEIEDFVHISPNAAIAGNVIIGEGSHLGIGSCVIQQVKIGKWVTIGAGSVVIRDIPDFAVVVGNPAKIIRFNNQ